MADEIKKYLDPEGLLLYNENVKQFVNDKIHNADYSQNDPDAPSYIQNRTHWEEEEPNLGEAVTVEDINFIVYNSNSYLCIRSIPELTLVTGQKYDVTFAGGTWTCVAQAPNNNCIYIGNNSLSSSTSTDTGEPFLVKYYVSYNSYDILTTPAYSTQTSITIIPWDKTSVHQLDEKYIPDTIARTADVEEIKDQLGVPEAPIDGNAYIRQDGEWVQNTSGFSDAPADGGLYLRRDGEWVPFAYRDYTENEPCLYEILGEQYLTDFVVSNNVGTIYYDNYIETGKYYRYTYNGLDGNNYSTVQKVEAAGATWTLSPALGFPSGSITPRTFYFTVEDATNHILHVVQNATCQYICGTYELSGTFGNPSMMCVDAKQCNIPLLEVGDKVRFYNDVQFMGYTFNTAKKSYTINGMPSLPVGYVTLTWNGTNMIYEA